MADIGKISGGVTGAVLSSGANIGANLIAYGANKALAKQANDFNINMYNKQRADYLADRAHDEQYNSPALQKARYRNAGMNPLQFMGDAVGSTSATNGVSAPSAVVPDSTPLANMANSGALGLNALMVQSDVLKNLATATKTNSENGIIARTADDVCKSFKLSNDKTYQDIVNAKETCKYLVAHTKNEKLRAELTERTLPLMVDYQRLYNAVLGEDLTSKSINNEWLPKEKQLGVERLKADISSINARAGLDRALTAKTRSETATIEKMREVNYRLAVSAYWLQEAQREKTSGESRLLGVSLKWSDKEHENAYNKVCREIDMLRRQYKWLPATSVAGIFKDVGVGLAGIGGAFSSVAGGISKLPTL